MSFILDALKKSETDRQRQNGPALYEVRVAPPRNALPLWAIGLAVLLAVNLVIVAWVLLRHPSSADTAANAATPQATTMVPAPAAVQQAPTMPPAPNTVPVNGTAPTAPLAQTAGMTQPPQGSAPMTNAAQTAAGSPGTATIAPVPQQAPSLNGSTTAESNASQPQADTGGADKVNPDDYAPAADPGPSQPFGNHVSRATASGVPLYQDVALNTHLPTLRLDLHVFAAQPQERFVMINMHKLHEGDSLPAEGVRVESITPGGAVLSHDGMKFLLPRE